MTNSSLYYHCNKITTLTLQSHHVPDAKTPLRFQKQGMEKGGTQNPGLNPASYKYFNQTSMRDTICYTPDRTRNWS